MLSTANGSASEPGDLAARAKQLARETTIIDMHMDVPYRLWKEPTDVSARTEDGDFDFERAREGGLDALFMAIFSPPEYEENGTARALADSLIDMVEGLAVKAPEKFGIATGIGDVEALGREGKIAVLLGMENGAPLAGDIENVGYFHRRGVRYITLVHTEDNRICDSSFDDSRTWKGLSPFGKAVVREMNRIGMMIDVSHVSDDAFYQVVELSEAPVIATHSGCRHFTPGWERNIDDRMIEALAAGGGMVGINFGSFFVNDESRRKFSDAYEKTRRYARDRDLDMDDAEVRGYWKALTDENPIGYADVSDVADHIDHVVKLVGVEHVGFGSDFDGLGDTLPTGLKDVSDYPNLILELLKRGYTDGDIKKICSENVLRVWAEVEQTARGPR
jgi:membrane dipeptidase